MRGRRLFRKHFIRLSSGKFRWSITNSTDDCLAFGVAPSKQSARDQSMERERALFEIHGRAEKKLPADARFRDWNK